ncbi:MAG TPA: ABC transporter ATP-binding protein [Burkholderiales bacterium]|nr:ABC transporter ATP-binding protein [Burkholderiales bacterium]
MEIVRLESVYKEYPLGNHMVQALTDVSFTVQEGSLLAIAGPSGSGKSTLLNLIGHIDVPSRGAVIVAGHDITGKTPDELADLRLRTIGFIFQSFNLFPVLSAEENVEYPLLQMRELKRKERKQRVADLLSIVGLSKYARHRPNQLSGGQRQRVAIARALVTRPSIVLADEPTANLDHKTGLGILTLMKEINRSLKTTFIFSSHDQKVIDFADHYLGIEDGEIRYFGIRKDDKWLVHDDWRGRNYTGKTTSSSPGARGA